MEPILEKLMERQMIESPHVLQLGLWYSSEAVEASRAMWEEVLLHRLFRTVAFFQPKA